MAQFRALDAPFSSLRSLMELGQDAVNLQRHLCELAYFDDWNALFTRDSTMLSFRLSSADTVIKCMSCIEACLSKVIHGRSGQRSIRIA